MKTLIRAIGVMGCVLVTAGAVRAQGPGGYQGQQPGAVQLFSNPSMNPYMNPYAAGMMPNNPDFLLYMYANNQANGGFGTGVMSGTRPGQGQQMGSNGQMLGPVNKNASMSRNAVNKGSQTRGKGGPKPALMPLATSVPGSGAAGYFARSFDPTGGAGKFYNRTSGRFQNNGR